MKTFKFEVKETLLRTVEIKAETEQEAEEKIQEMYDGEEIVLDWSDCISNEIELIESEAE